MSWGDGAAAGTYSLRVAGGTADTTVLPDSIHAETHYVKDALSIFGMLKAIDTVTQ